MELKELTNRLFELTKKIINTNMIEYISIYEDHKTSPKGVWSPQEYYTELSELYMSTNKIALDILGVNVLDFNYDLSILELKVRELEEDYNKLLTGYNKDFEVMSNYEDED